MVTINLAVAGRSEAGSSNHNFDRSWNSFSMQNDEKQMRQNTTQRFEDTKQRKLTRLFQK